MNAIYKVTIRTDQVDAAGRSAVRVRIRKAGQTRYLQTGIFLKYHRDKRKSEWNEDAEEGKNNWVTSRHFDHAALNLQLVKSLKRLRHIESEHPTYTATQIRDAYGQPEEAPRRGFLAFAREWIARKEKLGQHGSAEVYRTQLGYFSRYWGERPDDPARLTPSTVAEMVHFFRTCDTRKGKGTGYGTQTINDALAVYRTFFRHGILEGWIAPMPNPFDLPPVEAEHPALERPTASQVMGLRELEGLSEPEHHARNVFLMQFFLNGARVSEVYTLKWADVTATHIRFKPRKRSRGTKTVPRHEGIEWILAQYPKEGPYIFPYLQAGDATAKDGLRQALYKRVNARINSALRRVAVRAGLPHLTSHMQRHAFADHVWQQTGDIRAVQELLGHADVQATQLYMKRLGQQQQDALSLSLYAAAQGNVRETFAAQPVREGRPATGAKRPKKGK
ncbi:site-specific recombinase XerD [Pontibacter mucosus]|uniref:Site-specific recombinase XerD n=1 Tax=Pontibacter mucosus TaxID=1649266 RepID=A0A2T5YCZ7_9BACT|nr:tyrosine-type recombinase/integrase [Pontibacter mucosus]PTX14392.1 site-specific recombinase XerD [Pontibacter mucosus]